MTANIRFPSSPGAIREGLLATGRPGAEDSLFVEYTSSMCVRFAHQKAVVGTVIGPDVAIVPGREYRLEVWHSGTAQRLAVSLDRVGAWNAPASFYPTSAQEIAFGRGAAGMPDVHPFSGTRARRRGILYTGGERSTVF